MIYNLAKKEDIQDFKDYSKRLIDEGKKVELTQKRNKRSLSQNNYLHLILSWFAVETGYTLEEVKQDVFKRYVCRELFITEKNGILICRSTSSLDTKELSQAVDTFRNWSSSEMNIYLPSANETDLLTQLGDRLDNYKQFL